MKRITIPKLDANLEEGTLGAWMVKEGERVRKGQPVVEFITDKAVFEIEAPGAGSLRRIAIPEKSVIPIGTIIGLIGRPDEPLPDIDAENRPLLERHRAGLAGAGGEQPPVPVAAAGERRLPRATPAARRLARRKGIALESVPTQAGAPVITVAMIEALD